MKRAGLCIGILIMLIILPVFFVSGQRAFADDTERSTIVMNFSDISVTYTDETLPAPDHVVYEELHERRINAPHAEKIRKVEECMRLGASPKASVLYCYPRLQNKVDMLIKLIDCDPVNSMIRFRPYETPMFTISKERAGYSVNEERLYYDIYSALRRGAHANIAVRADTLAPGVTAEDLKECTYKRAAFSTDFSSSNENRKHNIRLALSKINGKMIMPGEEFSFNKTVGKRTEANGYQLSKIIMDGEYVDGVGGGVCQASTTVYNAALLADMEITDARSHSLVPSYVQPSMDAMVTSSYSDLKFRNKSDMPVFIRAYGTGSKACVEFFGTKLPYKIATESKVISRTAAPVDIIIDDKENKYNSADMLPGEERRVAFSAPGLASEGYLCYYRDGRLIERKLIRKDVYKPVQGIIVLKPPVSELPDRIN